MALNALVALTALVVSFSCFASPSGATEWDGKPPPQGKQCPPRHALCFMPSEDHVACTDDINRVPLRYQHRMSCYPLGLDGYPKFTPLIRPGWQAPEKTAAHDAARNDGR